MPIISMFYGIIIRMYLIDNQHHNLPHFHAKYVEYEARPLHNSSIVIASEAKQSHNALISHEIAASLCSSQ